MRSIHLFILSMVLLWAVNVDAQSSYRFGIQGGLNIANANTSPTHFPKEDRLGFLIGGHMDISITGTFSVQPELLYVQKGAEFTIEEDIDLRSTTNWKYDYIELPVLLKLHLGERDIKPVIFAGPSIGYNINAKAESLTNEISETENLKDDTRPFEFGLYFGAGGVMNLSQSTALTIHLRYSLGLSDVDKDSRESWKSNGIQIVTGVRF